MRSRSRAFRHEERLDFSFSGLKTAVLYALRGQNATQPATTPPPALVADLAASFQEAVLDVLISKTRQAVRQTGLKRLGVGGGVAANAALRNRLATFAAEENIELFIPPLSLCTDNAALGAVAFPKLVAGQTAPLDCDVQAGLIRPRDGNAKVAKNAKKRE